MSIEFVGQIIVGALGVLAAAVPLFSSRQAGRSRRDDLQSDVDLLLKLPDGAVKQRLEQHVLSALDDIETAKDRRREPFGVALALTFIGLSTFGGIWLISKGGWWLFGLIGVALVFALGAAGLARDLSKRKRDPSGRPID